MVHGDLKGVGFSCSTPLSISNNSPLKANVLIDETSRARLADFGMLAIISDATGLASSSLLVHGGTLRWMSPELFYPEDFGFKDSRRTKHSDCYALGMVIYEVLSGHKPFPHHGDGAVVAKVCRGERPERPEGLNGYWFTDVVWRVLERCWMPNRDDRSSIEDVLRSLEEPSRSWTPLSHPTVESPPTMDSPTWFLSDSSTGGSAGKFEVSSLSRVAPSLPSQTHPPKGDGDYDSIYPSSSEFPALSRGALDHRCIGLSVENSKRLDLKEPVGILDTVGGIVLPNAFWY